MKKSILILLIIIMSPSDTRAQIFLYPVIQDFGGVRDVPFAVEKPDATMEYKIVVEMGDKIEDTSEVSEPLDAAARMYNLHVYGGVPQDKIHMAVVIFAGSTAAILNNEAYHEKFGVDNPNLKLISEMKKAGIEIYVCGQSVMKAELTPSMINPEVTIATSRFTAVTTLQMKGYVFYQL